MMVGEAIHGATITGEMAQQPAKGTDPLPVGTEQDHLIFTEFLL